MSRGASFDDQEKAKADANGDGNGKTVAPVRGTHDEMRAWMAAAIGAQTIGDATRFGGDMQAPASLALTDIDGNPRTIYFETERDIGNHKTLGGELVCQGNVPAFDLNNAKNARDFYFLFCRIAVIRSPMKPLDQFRGRVDAYRNDAIRTEGWDFGTGKYALLRSLQACPYSKRALSIWKTRCEQINYESTQPPKPQPPLHVVDNHDGTQDEWTTIGHLGTYVRHHDDEQSLRASDKSLAGSIIALGGQRRPMQAWAEAHSGRVNKIDLILIRLPRLDEDPDYPARPDSA
jgi:hypothetical protein